MLQFIPFDDRWFDADEALPGRLVPYHVGVVCAPHVRADLFAHCAAVETSSSFIASPTRAPNLTAAPALSSST